MRTKSFLYHSHFLYIYLPEVDSQISMKASSGGGASASRAAWAHAIIRALLDASNYRMFYTGCAGHSYTHLPL